MLNASWKLFATIVNCNRASNGWLMVFLTARAMKGPIGYYIVLVVQTVHSRSGAIWSLMHTKTFLPCNISLRVHSKVPLPFCSNLRW